MTDKMEQYKTRTFKLNPEVAFDDDAFHHLLKSKFGANYLQHVRVVKRSIDARSKQIKVHVQVAIFDDSAPEEISYKIPSHSVASSPPVVIVGAGPAGLFAALKAIDLGVKPIILERGKDVRSRRRDLAAINKDHVVNPESNYCFGEGGAGTYSDGKLYTRSHKRGSIIRILEILVAHGAKSEILYDAHPHIGTNKLPKIIENMRETILNCGGEIHFNTKVDDFAVKNGELVAVGASQVNFEGIGTILATGHSARDIFKLLQQRNIDIEAKPFALGVRIEHAQQTIDSIQYHSEGDRSDYLPAAAYSLVQKTNFEQVERGVFSFCMCPGGFVVPAATSPGEVVVNGMSPSRRNSKFANSGMVVSIEPEDLVKQGFEGIFSCMDFQTAIERKNFEMAGKTQVASAQRTVDFVDKKVSQSLLETSYQPGLASVDLHELLPKPISKRLQMALKQFGKRMKGYLTNESQLIGVESRTSSPIRIPRDRDTCEHVSTKRLFPCAEGAGYAGGIVSAAMDGERCMENIVKLYKPAK